MTLIVLIASLLFPACEYEDSINCVWNASEVGNGDGMTFVDIGGTAYYLD